MAVIANYKDKILQAAGFRFVPPAPFAFTTPDQVVGLSVSQTVGINKSGEVEVTPTLTWNEVVSAYGNYTVAYKNITNGAAVYKFFDTNDNSAEIPINLALQNIVVKVKSNFGDKSGIWSAEYSFTTDSDTIAPAVTGFTGTGGVDYITLTITRPTERDYSHTQIWFSTTNDRSNASIVGETSDTIKTFSDIPTTSGFVWIKHVDTTGNIGNFYPTSDTGGYPVTTTGISGGTLIDGQPATDLVENASSGVTDSFSVSEKTAIAAAWNVLTDDYNYIVTSAGNLSVTTTDIATAYAALQIVVDQILLDMAVATTHDRTAYNTLLTGFYLQRDITSYDIREALRALGAPNGTFVSSMLAQDVVINIDAAKSRLDDKDDILKITPSEKLLLKVSWDELAVKHADMVSSGIIDGAWTTAYNNLYAVLQPIFGLASGNHYQFTNQATITTTNYTDINIKWRAYITERDRVENGLAISYTELVGDTKATAMDKANYRRDFQILRNEKEEIEAAAWAVVLDTTALDAAWTTLYVHIKPLLGLSDVDSTVYSFNDLDVIFDKELLRVEWSTVVQELNKLSRQLIPSTINAATLVGRQDWQYVQSDVGLIKIGTPLIGATTVTMDLTTKPGASTATNTWIKVTLNGKDYWLPAWEDVV